MSTGNKILSIFAVLLGLLEKQAVSDVERRCQFISFFSDLLLLFFLMTLDLLLLLVYIYIYICFFFNIFLFTVMMIQFLNEDSYSQYQLF